MPSNRTILDRLACRQVLNVMVILGFMLNYMLRVNMTIAIVSMVLPTTDDLRIDNRDMSNGEPLGDRNAASVPLLGNESDAATSHLFPDPTGRVERIQTRYPWNEYQVNLILGSFYWGYVCTELPGGRLAEIIGPKTVFGYSMLISSAITFLTPVSATYGCAAVVALRAVLGLMLGATWPAIQPMIARWIPPTERSKFVSNMMASSLGAAITMPICGFLIPSMGWQSVFYVTGAVGIAWSAAWFLLIFDSPAQHPRISADERRYIEEALGTTTATATAAKRLPVPWKSIFLSAPVWSIVLTHACNVFGYFTVVNQLPTYMKYILNFNIKENGLLSSLPYLGKYVFAVMTSSLADYLSKKNKLSVTVIRKIFTTFAVLTPGLLMIIQANHGSDPVVSVIIFVTALTANGAVTAGYLGNGLDIAPNFSGTIFGIMNTLGSLGGFLSSYMVGTITYRNQSYARWSIIFWILASTYFTGALTFAIFGSGQLQKWNSPAVEEEEEEEEEEREAPGKTDVDAVCQKDGAVSLKDESTP